MLCRLSVAAFRGESACRAAVQGGRTAVDWLYLLLAHLAIVPAPADCPPIEIVSGRKIDRRGQELVVAQLFSAELALVQMPPSICAAAALGTHSQDLSLLDRTQWLSLLRVCCAVVAFEHDQRVCTCSVRHFLLRFNIAESP